MQTAIPASAGEVRAAWRELKTIKKLRNREAALELGISEAELVASAVGDGAIRLKGDLRHLLKRMPELGTVMALTRNESCVHEKDGPYLDISAEGMMGLALGELIDLRLFFAHWKHAYAVTEESPRGTLRSLQIYDASGTAVHKIYLRPSSNLDNYLQLVKDFADDNQAPGEKVAATPVPAAPRPDAEIDAAGLRQAWANLKDTHDFFGMLKKFGVARIQALRLAGRDFARPVANDAARHVLEAASAEKTEIMVFVGNRGCIQIHTGPVASIKVMGPWVNVMDPGFNLHLREDRIAQCWVVAKPTTDGVVTSVEIFDADGELITQFFGKRKPGIPESTAWRELVARIFPVVIRLALAAALATASGLAIAQQRVISIGGAVTEIVYALGEGKRLVAADTTSTEPEAARALPRVGYMRTLSAEGVLSMNPQLVFVTPDAGPGTALAQIRGAGVAVAMLSNEHSFDALKGNVRAVAAALGTKVEGAALERRLEAEWSRTAVELKKHAARPKVLFVLAHSGAGILASGEGTAANAMIGLAGGVNAVRGTTGYKPLTAEAAIAAAPDVVLITTEGVTALGGEQNLWTRPGLALTPAGGAKRLVVMDALTLLGFGPRLPQAVRELAQKLDPW